MARIVAPAAVCAGRYEIGERLGSGSFGEVYRGSDQETGQPVAVKFEDSRTGQLHKELEILRKLQEEDEEHPQGFVKILYFGRKGERFCLVMECLGRSLEEVFRQRGNRFTVKTTVLVAQQMLSCIEHLHSKGAVHRDIKPENFMCGVGARRHHLYMIDFGLAEWYFREDRHVPLRKEDEFRGTMRYASINAQRYCTQSRRDDLEAAGHTWLYFLRGDLPWSGLQAETKADQYRKVRELKEQTPVSALCAGFPTAFEKYLGYCRRLAYEQRPDYATLHRLLWELRAKLARDEGCPIEDHDFEWESGREEERAPIARRSQARQPDDPLPPLCPTCSRDMAWSDFHEGVYSCGWSCNNMERCHNDRTAIGECRWFCQTCSNDFCPQCAASMLTREGAGSTSSTASTVSSASRAFRRLFLCQGKKEAYEPAILV